MAYVSGQHIVDRLNVRLQKLGCELTQSEELNHKYKLDFIITRFDGIAKMRPIGIQVTTRPSDREKMREFLARQRQFEYVEKALYIELNNNEIDQGIDRLVYGSIVYFLFSTSFSKIAFLGLRVRPNFTVDFFDLEAEAGRATGAAAVLPIAREESQPAFDRSADRGGDRSSDRGLERGGERGGDRISDRPRAPTPQRDEPAPGSVMTGTISAINQRGYGFIQGAGLSHFFPFSKVEDQVLREVLNQLQLEARPWVKELNIPVRFLTLGRVRSPDHDPQADKIVRNLDADAAPNDEDANQENAGNAAEDEALWNDDAEGTGNR